MQKNVSGCLNQQEHLELPQSAQPATAIVSGWITADLSHSDVQKSWAM